MNTSCKNCGKRFKPRWDGNVFCSNTCRLHHLHESRRLVGKFFAVICWTEEEDAVLKKYYPDPYVTFDVLVSMLPGRTKRAIEHRLSALGVRRYVEEGKTHSIRPSMRGDNSPSKKRVITDEDRKEISRRAKETTCFRYKNKDPEFQKKRLAAWSKAVHAGPNKLESYLTSVIEEACPGEYEYTGNGGFTIDGMCPDWACKRLNKTIELFGRSFHDPKYCAWVLDKRRTEKGRAKVFAEFGFSMFVIWDDFAKVKKNREAIVQQIREYHEK